MPVRSKKYSQFDVQQQNHFAVQFTGVFAPKASSLTNKTPYTKSLPLCFAVCAEFRLAGVSARSSVNLPVLALALSALRCLLTVYSSSHLVRPVLRRLCAYEAFIKYVPPQQPPHYARAWNLGFSPSALVKRQQAAMSSMHALEKRTRPRLPRAFGPALLLGACKFARAMERRMQSQLSLSKRTSVALGTLCIG